MLTRFATRTKEVQNRLTLNERSELLSDRTHSSLLTSIGSSARVCSTRFGTANKQHGSRETIDGRSYPNTATVIPGTFSSSSCGATCSEFIGPSAEPGFATVTCAGQFDSDRQVERTSVQYVVNHYEQDWHCWQTSHYRIYWRDSCFPEQGECPYYHCHRGKGQGSSHRRGIYEERRLDS